MVKSVIVSLPLPPETSRKIVPELTRVSLPLPAETSPKIVPELIRVLLPSPSCTLPEFDCSPIFPELMNLSSPLPPEASPEIVPELIRVLLPSPSCTLATIGASPIIPELFTVSLPLPPTTSPNPTILAELVSVLLPSPRSTAENIVPVLVTVSAPLPAEKDEKSGLPSPTVPEFVRRLVPSPSATPSTSPELVTVSAPLPPETVARRPELATWLVPSPRSTLPEMVLELCSVSLLIPVASIPKAETLISPELVIVFMPLLAIWIPIPPLCATMVPALLMFAELPRKIPTGPPCTSPSAPMLMVEMAVFPAARSIPTCVSEATIPLTVTVQPPVGKRNAPWPNTEIRNAPGLTMSVSAPALSDIEGIGINARQWE